MKIFSLETKKQLVVSVFILSTLFFLATSVVTFNKFVAMDGGSIMYQAGWPIEYQYNIPHKLLKEDQLESNKWAVENNSKQLLLLATNFIVWYLISFLILFLIRSLKYKKS